MKRLLSDPYYIEIKKKEKTRNKAENTDRQPTTTTKRIEKTSEVLQPKPEALVKQNNSLAPSNQNSEITTKDCLRMKELFEMPRFKQMLSVLSTKEATIISLKLGYSGKYYSNEAIANLLGISLEEVNQTTYKVEDIYKEALDAMLDEIIGKANYETKPIIPTF